MTDTLDMRRFVPATIKASKRKDGVQKEFPADIWERADKLLISYSFPIRNGYGTFGVREIDGHLPKTLSANQDTFEVLGLLQGEMSKTHRGPITMCNSEPEIMRCVLEWFRTEFDLPHSEWHWYIKINLPEPEDEELREQLEDGLVEHWMRECPIDYEQRYPTTVAFVKTSKNEIPKNEGTLTIERRDPIFVQTLQKLVRDITKSMPDRPEEEIIPFMRGIIAAESCINYRLASGHRRVFITAVDDEERDVFIRCLEKLGVEPNECKPIKDIIISRRKNLERLHALDLMTLHPAKHANFSEMLGSYGTRKTRAS